MAQSVAHSIVSNKKTSTVSEGKSKAHPGAGAAGGKGATTSSGDGTSQVSCSTSRGGSTGGGGGGGELQGIVEGGVMYIQNKNNSQYNTIPSVHTN